MSSTAQTSPSRPPSSKDPAEYTEAPEHELNSTAAQHIITEEKPQVATQYVTGVKLGLIVVMMGLACFLVLLDTMVISTAIPRITDDFNSLPDVGWYASAYQFGSAAPQPLAGKLYTHFSNKWSFLLFFGIFELGSVLCGAAVSSPMLIIGRAVAGIGAAGIINGAIIIVSSSAPKEKRPGLMGLTIGVSQLGLALGPLIGGAFTTYSTWRWSFYINLPIGAVVALAVFLLRINEQTPKGSALSVIKKLPHYLDLIGFVLFAPAVLQLLLALQFGGTRFAWKSSQVIGLFCGSAANFAVWNVWNYRKGDNALLPPSMIGKRTVWTSGLYAAFFMSALYGAAYFLPIYFQAVNGVSAMLSGVYLLPTILPELFFAAFSGFLQMKLGYLIPIAIVSIVFLATGSGLYSILQPGSPTGYWAGFQVIAGIGSGLGLNLAIVAVQAAVTEEELSSAMAFVVFAQSMGPAITLVLCNVILLESLRSQIPQYAPSADPAAIIGAGATRFRGFVQEDELPGVLLAYANSLDRTFYLVAACACVCAVTLWGMGWIDIRRKDVARQSSESIVDETKERKEA